MEKRCMGCMKIKMRSPLCEHCGFDDRAQNGSDHLPMGTVLRDQYVIGKVLGQGGFGITYLGWDKNLDMPVAVKEFFPRGVVMRDSTINQSVQCYSSVREDYKKSKERFLREAKTLAKFIHIPEIVRVQNFFEENNTAYIVMEYVRGVNLHQHMVRCGGRLSMDQTLALLKPVMEALIQVHREHVVHRDISPDNIMLLEGGKAKLLDFGAVREIGDPDAQGMLTHSTQAILKRGFAPVEQYQSRGALGPWTDVYALCATIYCCLTGTVPPESQELMMEGRRISWEQVPGLNQQQREILRKGTELLPGNRLASVQGLYDVLYRQQGNGYQNAPSYTVPVWENITGGVTEPVKRKPVEKPVRPTPAAPAQPAQPAKKSRADAKAGSWKTVIIGLAVMVACFAWSQISGGRILAKESNTPGTGDAVIAETTGVIAQDNILMENKSIALSEQMKEEKAFNTDIRRTEVRTVTFLRDVSQAPLTAKDASQKRNGCVKSWAEKNGELYDLYIAAEGGVFAPENSGNLFAGMDHLREIRFADAFSTGNVTSMKGMFSGCKNLIKADVSGFDTSKVTNMWSMFYECESLVELDVSGFDTSSVTGMRYMFYHCRKLETLDVSGFDTGNVTDMLFLFTNCENLTELDVSQWNTSNVEEMGWLFGNCYKLETLDVSSWDTSKAVDMSMLFYGCENLRALDLSGWDTSSAIDMASMFHYCFNLKSVNVSGWNTANVTDMMSMFGFCKSLTSLDLSSFDTTLVETMQNMFYGCENLKNLNVSSFRVSGDTVTTQMFYDCPAARPYWYKE